MFDSIWNDMKRELRYGNMVSQLIIVNVAVFLCVLLVKLAMFLGSQGNFPHEIFSNGLNWLCLSSDWWHIVTRPWTPFTSMILHEGLGHIFWNMLFLWWFGRIVGDLIGDRRVLPIYLLCGLGGALLYFISMNFVLGSEFERHMLGASGAITGIMLTAGFLAPDYRVNLLFIGEVALKYVVGFMLVLDLVFIANNENTGGHFCHLGGAITGWLYVTRLRDGRDWADPVNRWIDWISALFTGRKTSRSRAKVAWRNPEKMSRSAARPTPNHAVSDSDEQARIDAILDKIKQHGYEKLTDEEKEVLFKASKK